uniref:Uncharacterized protein n=1 Tax=Arundo donax TaxID=35708 RepID=A0A0A9B078_ARUDO
MGMKCTNQNFRNSIFELMFKGLAGDLERPELKWQDLVGSQRLPVLDARRRDHPVLAPVVLLPPKRSNLS